MFMNLKNKTLILLIIAFVLNIFFISNNLYNQKKTDKIKIEPSLEINKIIVIGDSRMELINNKRKRLNIPSNMEFIAKSGAKIAWLYEDGLPELFNLIDKEANYKYSVVFNMGVNDLDSSTEAYKLADIYFKLYKKIINKYPNISFYFLSVNPVDDDVLRRNLPSQKRTNERIKEFNDYFIYKLSKQQMNNVRYCDSYNTLEFELPDGLHYSTQTDKKIIDYIIKECSDTNFNYNYFR